MTKLGRIALLTTSLAASLGSPSARAQLRSDALVQSPTLERPARGTLGSSLAGFELGPSALARGSSALPSPFQLPLERGQPALELMPSYVADQGLSEWGMGWSVSLSIRRYRPVGPLDYASDRFQSPWGPLSRGEDGAYYVDGFAPRIRLELDGDAWTALGEDGTRYRFASSDALATARGGYEWWLSEATTLTGERTQFHYDAGSDGRRYLARASYGGRAGVPQVEVVLAYAPLDTAFVDRRSGQAVSLDRRVTSVSVQVWDPEQREYRQRYRYELEHELNPAGVAHYLTRVQRVFASGQAEPAASFRYRFGEQDAALAQVREAPRLSSYLERFGPGSLSPGRATYLDVDKDGRTDLESALDHTLAVHGETGLEFRALERDGSEDPLCRPAPSPANAPRSLLRLAPGGGDLTVVRFASRGGDTTVLHCTRQGHLLGQADLTGDYRPGANTRLADLDRDLRPDLVRVGRGRVEIRRQLGSATLSFGEAAQQSLEPAIEPLRSWVDDLTGDGVADLVSAVSSALYVWPGLGTGAFEAQGVRLSLSTTNGAPVASLESAELAFVDANRDGLKDVLLSSGAVLRLLTQRGDGFREQRVPAFEGLSWDFSYPITVDLEGLGEEQAIVSAGEVAYAIAFTSPSAGLLIAADDDKGGALRIDYERAPADPGLVSRPPLVSVLHVSDAGQDPVDHRFEYAEPAFHTQGEYLIGYRRVRREGPTAVDEVELHHDDVQTALPLRLHRVDLAAPGLPPGLYHFEETQYEPAQFRGLRYLRPVTWSSGLGAAGGQLLSSSLRREVAFDESGLCPLEERLEAPGSSLVTRRTLAQPAALAGALHCLLSSEREEGSHPGRPQLDFEQLAIAERNALGQLVRLEQSGGGSRQVLQEVEYDEQHRPVLVRVPGRGETRASYHQETGALLQLRAPDGTVLDARRRDPLSTALLELEEQRGALPYAQHFAYDGLERLRQRHDLLGQSSAAQPDELFSYAFAATERPGSVVSSVLVDAARSTRASAAEWLSASGKVLARGARIPEGWALTGIQREHRAVAQLESLRRDPLGRTDAHAATLSELFDASRSTRLGLEQRSSFGHLAWAESLLQAGTTRRLETRVSLDARGLVRTRFDGGALLDEERADGDGRVTARLDALGGETRLSYDALGRLVAVELPGGARQTLAFDGLGRPSRTDRTGIGFVEHAYAEESGLLVERRYYDSRGALVRRTTLDYDGAGREVRRDHELDGGAAAQRYQFFHDGARPGAEALPGHRGRLTGVSGPRYQSSTEYLPDGRIARRSLELQGFRTVVERFDYFEDGVLRSHAREVREPGGALLIGSVRRTERDAFGREIRVDLERAGDTTSRTLYELHYDAEGRIDQIALGDAAAPASSQSWVQLLYDAATHQPRGYLDVGADWELQVEPSFDSRGLIESERVRFRGGSGDSEPHDRRYRYDARRFLIGLESPEGDAAYGYAADGLLSSARDAEGPRTLERAPGQLRAGSLDYLFDDAGRLVRRGDLELVYGANGQIETAFRAGRRFDFSYDADDQRLLELEEGRPVRAYLGDALLTEDTLIEPLKVAGRVVGLIENGLFRPLSTDPRSSVLAEPARGYLPLSPYGVREPAVGRPSAARALDFAARGHHPDLGLVRMGVRDYDPFAGQFTTPDPLFLAQLDKCQESPVECNLYGYAKNDPVGFIDAAGTQAVRLSNEKATLPGKGAAVFLRWQSKGHGYTVVTEAGGVLVGSDLKELAKNPQPIDLDDIGLFASTTVKIVPPQAVESSPEPSPFRAPSDAERWTEGVPFVGQVLGKTAQWLDRANSEPAQSAYRSLAESAEQAGQQPLAPMPMETYSIDLPSPAYPLVPLEILGPDFMGQSVNRTNKTDRLLPP